LLVLYEFSRLNPHFVHLLCQPVVSPVEVRRRKEAPRGILTKQGQLHGDADTALLGALSASDSLAASSASLRPTVGEGGSVTGSGGGMAALRTTSGAGTPAATASAAAAAAAAPASAASSKAGKSMPLVCRLLTYASYVFNASEVRVWDCWYVCIQR
jgi:hypothetical protein